MERIYKYELPMTSDSLRLPKGAQIIDIAIQNEKPYCWAIVEEFEERTQAIEFIVVATGSQARDFSNLKHLRTLHFSNGLVWHYFIEIPEIGSLSKYFFG